MISAIGALFKSSDTHKEETATDMNKDLALADTSDEKFGIDAKHTSTDVASSTSVETVQEKTNDNGDDIVPDQAVHKSSEPDPDTKSVKALIKATPTVSSMTSKTSADSKSKTNDKKNVKEPVEKTKIDKVTKGSDKTSKKSSSNGQSVKADKTTKTKAKQDKKPKPKSKAKTKSSSKSKKESSSSESESESDNDDDDSDSESDNGKAKKSKAKPKAKPSPKTKTQSKTQSKASNTRDSKSSSKSLDKAQTPKPAPIASVEKKTAPSMPNKSVKLDKPDKSDKILEVEKEKEKKVSTDVVVNNQVKIPEQVLQQSQMEIDQTSRVVTTDNILKHARPSDVQDIDAAAESKTTNEHKMDETSDQPRVNKSDETKDHVDKQSKTTTNEQVTREDDEVKTSVKAKPVKRKRSSVGKSSKDAKVKSDKPEKSKTKTKVTSDKPKAKKARVTFQDSDKNKEQTVKVTEPSLQSLCLSHLAKSVNATSAAIVTMLGRYHPMTLINNTFAPIATCVIRTDTEYKQCHGSPCGVHKEVPKTVPRDVNLFITTIGDCVNTLSNVESFAKHPQADDQLKVVQEMTRLYASVQYSYVEIKEIIQRVCVATLQALIQIVPTDSSDARAARKILQDRGLL